MTRIDELRALVMTTDQLIGRGHSSQSLERAVSTGGLIRLRPGHYVEGAARELNRADRHLLSVLATDSAMDGPVFTHWSAAVVHGLPDWRLPLGRVSISRHGHAQRSRTTRLVRHDLCPVTPEEVVDIGGVSVTSAARTIIDVARACDAPTGIVQADAGLQRKLVTEESLHDALERAAGRNGIKRARSTMMRTDARSESVAETRSRLYFAEYGLPEPETQVDIFDDRGRFVGRVDFLWREYGVIGECDGLGKYFEGADEAETRRRLGVEKDRDALLAALGYRVIHWRWADFDKPWLLIKRLRQVLLAAEST